MLLWWWLPTGRTCCNAAIYSIPWSLVFSSICQIRKHGATVSGHVPLSLQGARQCYVASKAACYIACCYIVPWRTAWRAAWRVGHGAWRACFCVSRNRCNGCNGRNRCDRCLLLHLEHALLAVLLRGRLPVELPRELPERLSRYTTTEVTEATHLRRELTGGRPPQ